MRINLLQLGTLGVDMKSNPLLLKNDKLHAATNLVFEEGVIKTRPGFIYSRTPASGQFQGAAEFRPRQGISSNRLSELYGGVVFVADGDVWAGCNKIGEGFFCKGDVNLFQAENYLILQCRETSTFWWDGASGLVASPGMNEQDWNDPEMPKVEIEHATPVADIPECDVEFGSGGVSVTFSTVNTSDESIIVGALVTIYKNNNRVAYGMTNAQGMWRAKVSPGAYTYSVTYSDYPPIENIDFTVRGTGTEYPFDECLPPQLVVTGEESIVVRMKGGLFMGVTVILKYDPLDDVCLSAHTCDAAIFDIYGNGVFIGKANLNNAVDGGYREAVFTLTSALAQQIAEASSDGQTIAFTFSCDPDPSLGYVGAQWGNNCHIGLGQLVIMSPDNAELYNGCPDGPITVDVSGAP